MEAWLRRQLIYKYKQRNTQTYINTYVFGQENRKIISRIGLSSVSFYCLSQHSILTIYHAEEQPQGRVHLCSSQICHKYHRSKNAWRHMQHVTCYGPYSLLYVGFSTELDPPPNSAARNFLKYTANPTNTRMKAKTSMPTPSPAIWPVNQCQNSGDVTEWKKSSQGHQMHDMDFLNKTNIR